MPSRGGLGTQGLAVGKKRPPGPKNNEPGFFEGVGRVKPGRPDRLASRAKWGGNGLSPRGNRAFADGRGPARGTSQNGPTSRGSRDVGRIAVLSS